MASIYNNSCKWPIFRFNTHWNIATLYSGQNTTYEIAMTQPAFIDPQSLAALAPRVEDFSRARILCIGDLMLDRFVYGAVERISPEAPIPVVRQSDERIMLGGAGNVVRNIISLGGQCSFISVIGDDASGHQLTRLVGEQERVAPYLMTEPGRISTEKTRYVSGTQQLLRCDRETAAAIQEATADRIIQIAEAEIANHEMVLLSDYGKGLLTDHVIRAVIEKANTLNIPVFVDPKRRDFSIYRGATLISPNLRELAAACGQDACEDETAIVDAARELISLHGLQWLMVTRGADGMTLVGANGIVTHIPAEAREVFDVSGAGDTVIATLAVARTAGLEMAECAYLATIAAGIVVGRLGTATVYRTDIKSALHGYNTSHSRAKLQPLEHAKEVVDGWKKQGLRVGFTNGCFDILHVGHLSSLQDAKAECDRLVVGINTDASVKRLKGDSRPLNNELDRAMLLAAIDCVDLVILFREDTPLNLLENLRPDVLMKGADYRKDQVVGGDLVESYGGRIALLPLREGYSSTNLIKKAQG